MLTNLDDRRWIVNIVEFASGTGNDSPGFTENVNSGRNHQGVGNQVGTGVEEDYLAQRILWETGELSDRRQKNVSTNPIKNFLQSSSIVCISIALGSVVSDADNLGNIVIRVRRPPFAEDATIFVEKTPILGDRGNIVPSITFGVVANVNVSLGPGVDMNMAGGAGEDRFTTEDADNS